MENNLWQNIVEGNKAAYEQLYVDYFKKLYNYGRKFTDNEYLIEDSIQEVFLAIWKNKEKLLQITSPDSYFFSTFRFILLKKIKESRYVQSSDDFEGEPEFSIEQILIEREVDMELKKKLEAALTSLTPRQKEAIFLRFYEGLSYEGVAAILDISVKATYKIMARSLLSLKEQLYNSVVIVALLLKLFKP